MTALKTKKKYSFTGNTAQKKLLELNQELSILYARERDDCTYSYIEGEEPVIPFFDLELNESKFEILSSNITIIKTALRKFNQGRKGPLTDLTIDEILVMMPLVSHRKNMLNTMRQRAPITRTTRNNVSEYCKINYDPEQVNKWYKSVSDTLTDLQEDLNYLNVTGTFEVELGEFD